MKPNDNPAVRYAQSKPGGLARCSQCRHIGGGYYERCDQPVSYVAEFRWLGGGGNDYPIRLCADHAAVARTHDSIKRIYSADNFGDPMTIAGFGFQRGEA